jgi:hypothetical protein
MLGYDRMLGKFFCILQQVSINYWPKFGEQIIQTQRHGLLFVVALLSA